MLKVIFWTNLSFFLGTEFLQNIGVGTDSNHRPNAALGLAGLRIFIWNSQSENHAPRPPTHFCCPANNAQASAVVEKGKVGNSGTKEEKHQYIEAWGEGEKKTGGLRREKQVWINTRGEKRSRNLPYMDYLKVIKTFENGYNVSESYINNTTNFITCHSRSDRKKILQKIKNFWNFYFTHILFWR